MPDLTLYSGMFLTIAIICGVGLLLCGILTTRILWIHRKYKAELQFAQAVKTELEAQLALATEVENFYYILLMDYVNTTGIDRLRYKTVLVRVVLTTLSMDPYYVTKVKKAMLQPGGTRTLLEELLRPSCSFADPRTSSALERMLDNVASLNQICEMVEGDRKAAQKKVGLGTSTIQPEQIRHAVDKSVEVLSENVRLVYDEEVLRNLQSAQAETEPKRTEENTENDGA